MKLTDLGMRIRDENRIYASLFPDYLKDFLCFVSFVGFFLLCEEILFRIVLLGS